MTKTIGIAVTAAAIAGAAVVVLSAQGRESDPPASRELVNEVRALRVVIERFAEAQGQTQALASLMTAQQRRVGEVTTRLDVVRRELDGTNVRYNDISRRLAAAEQMSPADMTGPGGTPAIDRRQALQELRSQLRNEFEIVSGQLGQLRARETEILNQAAFEEGRWRELTSRMEEWLKK